MSANSNVVVLGGQGFIGSAVVEYLQSRSDLDCTPVSSSNCDLLQLDRCIETLSPIVRGAVVVFAAGIPRLRGDTVDAMLDNQRMVHNLIDVFRIAVPQKVVFLSSVEVYGPSATRPITEETPLRPMRRYAIGKVAAEMGLQAWQRESGCPLAILRLPGIFGPNDAGRGLIGMLVKAIRAQTEFRLIGDGSALRDFVWVQDVARLIGELIGTKFDELILNLATGQSESVSAIMQRLFARFGECRVVHAPTAERDCDLVFDTSRLQKAVPGFKPTPLGEGLAAYETGRRKTP
ncbi:MAG: NAD-dependent epimerase/dehydratase family protein [Planctomycetota bacterium]|nr:NAD-dependent epimerase/dehydratase family protein [Planctomycetota bacterium]